MLRIFCCKRCHVVLLWSELLNEMWERESVLWSVPNKHRIFDSPQISFYLWASNLSWVPTYYKHVVKEEPSQSGRMVCSVVQWHAQSWVQTPTNVCGYAMCKYVDQKGLTPMLTSVHSVGVYTRGEVWDRGINDPTKRTCALQKLKDWAVYWRLCYLVWTQPYPHYS